MQFLAGERRSYLIFLLLLVLPVGMRQVISPRVPAPMIPAPGGEGFSLREELRLITPATGAPRPEDRWGSEKNTGLRGRRSGP